jgi:cytoskeletal protein RodZ
MAINDNNGNNPVDQTPVSGTTNHKAIYTALIAVIVILGAAVVYLAMGRNTEQPNNQQVNNTQNPTPTPTPTPNPTPNPSSTNPTANWKTYTNSKNGLYYEIKYPSNWTVATSTRYSSSSIPVIGGGPGENRTPASAMRMPRNTTLLRL